MKKRLMMILSVMLIALTCAFAAQEMTVTWEWRTDDDPEVNYYRWQLNGTEPEGWRIESGDTSEITVKELDPYQSYTLYLQRSYDGVNWSETASAEASALLVDEVAEEAVEEAPVEAPVVEEVAAPVEAAPVEEAPVEEAAVEEAPVEEVAAEAPAEEAPVEEAPVEEAAPVVIEEVAKRNLTDNFKFTFMFRPGAELRMDYDAKRYTQPSLMPFAVAFDFENIVSNEKATAGFGLRWNIDSMMYPVGGWTNLLGGFRNQTWNPGKWNWGQLFDFKDSYVWAVDTSILAMFNSRVGVADFGIGLGMGTSFLLDEPLIKRDTVENDPARLDIFHYQDVFKVEGLHMALYADLMLGARFYFNDVVSMGLEADYRMYVPNYKFGDVGVNATLGFTF